MKKNIFLVAFSMLSTGFAMAQSADSMMNMLDEEAKNGPKDEVNFTFKATRIINSSSVENLGAGVLDTRISHRFGAISDGSKSFWGVDNATTRLGIDYGITKWLMVGVGHNTLNKTNDGFIKAKLLPQQHDGIPVTLSYFGSMGLITTDAPTLPAGDKWKYTNRMSFVHQILIARKFSDKFSLQISPTVVHMNLVDSNNFDNNVFALGVGGRYKLTKRFAITGEYFYRFTGTKNLNSGLPTYNSLEIGVDVETGGHVFQMFFGNSLGMTEKGYIAQTTDSWSKSQLHFGFNISRVFTVVKPKEFRGKEGKEKW